MTVVQPEQSIKLIKPGVTEETLYSDIPKPLRVLMKPHSKGFQRDYSLWQVKGGALAGFKDGVLNSSAIQPIWKQMKREKLGLCPKPYDGVSLNLRPLE